MTFSYERGNDEDNQHIKISKGEESCFIWSIFYSLLDQVVHVLNIPEENDRETNQFDKLEYVFIDDPVSSLDDNHLIELAVNLAQLIKQSESDLKFVITTHNPLFYNVLHNEFKQGNFFLKKDGDAQFDLVPQNNDSPFSYHLFLKLEIEKAIKSGQLKKYHFNFLRNILEKTSTFLGYSNWGEILPKTNDGTTKSYESRIINISSHSKHSGEEISELTDDDKRVLEYLLNQIKANHQFK
nr:AAA family ATPase [uncultured Phascolarctobacterium sp.]